jgi:hypothetical protein
MSSRHVEVNDFHQFTQSCRMASSGMLRRVALVRTDVFVTFAVALDRKLEVWKELLV